MNGDKLIRYMKSRGYRIFPLNIVYLEDVNADTWEPIKKPKLDAWDDARILVKDDGTVIMSCEATTEPGRHYTYNRMNPKGAARIAFGNYKDAWAIGWHLGKQESLVQVAPIKVHRDANADGKRTNDRLDVGVFGINQHTTGVRGVNAHPELVGRWSAGCLVGRYSKTHYNVFMPHCRATGRKTFDTTIIAGDEFHAWRV